MLMIGGFLYRFYRLMNDRGDCEPEEHRRAEERANSVADQSLWHNFRSHSNICSKWMSKVYQDRASQNIR
jgi:hypothetical protein